MLLTWKRKKPTWIEVCSIFCCCGCRKCSLRYDCLMWLRHILLRLSWISNWNVCLSYFRFLISGSDFWHQALTHFRHFLYISHLFLSSPRPPSWSSSLITCVVFGCRWQSCFFKMLLYKKKKEKTWHDCSWPADITHSLAESLSSASPFLLYLTVLIRISEKDLRFCLKSLHGQRVVAL